MAWQMQSDKTGKVYDFDDDVTPQDALKYLDTVLEPQTKWEDVPAAAAKTIEAQGKNIAAGQLRLSELAMKLPGLPGLLGTAVATQAVPAAEQLEAEGKQLSKEAYGDTVPSFAQKAVGTAIPSIALNSVPLLFGAGKATAAVRGGEAAGAALASGLGTTLGIAATQEGIGEFSQQRAAGQDVVPAALAGGFSGLAEYAGERFAFTPVRELLTKGGGSVRKAIFDFIVKDQLGEQATTAMQAFNRKMTREPDMTLADWAEEAALTAASTAISGPVQAGIAGPTMSLATRGTPAAAPRVEPTGTIPQEETQDADTRGKTRLVDDSSLPIVGEELPGIVEDNSRELPLDQRLELLRRSWDEYNNKTFNDTAEDRIRKRGEFQRRRAEIEGELMLHPEGRALLRESDLALGLAVPTIELTLEQQVDDYAVLDEETLKQREAARTEIEPEEPGQTPFPKQLRDQLGVDPWSSGFNDPYNEVEMNAAVNPGSEKATQRHLAGKVVVAGSRTDLSGLPWEQIAPQLRPDDIVQVGQAGAETIEGAAGYMDLLRELKDRYMPDRPIVLGAHNGQSGNLGQAWITQEGVYAMPIPLGGTGIPATQFSNVGGLPGTEQINFSQIATDATDTLLHEFTHLLHFRHWIESSSEERKAVAQEYHDDMRFALNANFKDAVARLYSAGTATWMTKRWVESGRKLTDKFDPAFLSQFGAGPGYWYNFNEWMAHKGVKYFTQRLGTSPKTVGFFQRFVRAMQQYYREFVLRYADSGQNFNAWLDNIARRESKLKGLLSPEQVKAVREELVRDGLDPAIADMLAEVRGDDKAWLRQLRDKQIDEQTRDRIAQNEEAYLAQLGKLGEVSQRSKWLKGLKDNAYAQRLLAQEPFNNPHRFDSGHLFDALVSQIVNARTVTVVEKGFTAFRFNGKLGSVSAVYSPSSNHLQIHTGSYRGAAQQALETALAQFVMRRVAKDGKIMLSVTTSDGTREDLIIPHYLYAPPVTPKMVDVAQFRIPSGLAAIGRTLNLPGMNTTASAFGRFNAFFSKALGAYQLIKLNANVPGMLQEREALRNRMAYRHKWLSAANTTVEKWTHGLEKGQSDKLSKLLFDESESGKWLSVRHDDPNRPGHYIYMLDPQEAAKRGLGTKALEVYSEIRNDFTRFVDEWEKVGMWEIARGELSSTTHYAIAEMMRQDATVKQVRQFIDTALASIQNPHSQQRIRDQIKNLHEEFENWRAKPYMPYTRFGKYGVLVRGGQDGKTKYFEGYETLDEARTAAEELKGQFPGDAISSTYLEDVPYMLAGLPPSMLDAMRSRLNLTPTQQAQFSDILATLSHANSFIHRQQRKRGVQGYSEDALRAYSDYFRRGASFIARVKSEPELNDALNMLKAYIRTQTANANGEVNQVENLGRLHEWFERLHKYLNEAGSEFGELKSIVALWHFGFNLSTAVVNLTQVPFVTLPWLTARYGEGASLKALTQAYKDAAKMYTKKSPLTQDEEAMLEHATAGGFRNESQATVLAQLADGSALARVSAHSKFARGVSNFNHYAMWMFGKGELVNRDVTLLAAYRLKRQSGFNGKFDREAFDFARQAVEDTHNEYSMENRPELMRGGGSVIFQFMHFSQNMLFNMLGGDPSWWRIMLVQLMIGGLMGLPFADNLLQGAKAVGRIVFGKDWDGEREARLYLKEINANPDLVLRGITSDVFGFDLSKRLSFGDPIPGMQTLASHRKLQDVMYGAVGDVGGPGVSLIMNAMRFAAEDKTQFDTWKLVMPTALKNMAGAGKAFVEGKAKDRSGATIFEPDLWDVTGMSVGFQPKELSQAYTARTLQGEKQAYWTTRRKALLDMWDHLVTDRDRDREGVADFMKALREFNMTAPDAQLRVTGESLKQSIKARARARAAKEQGFGSYPAMQQSSKEISETFK